MSQQLGRYELLRPIGRGGMAEIWLGRRRGAGGIEKRVVIKRILRERVKDPRFLGLFVSEAQISMSLAHKNIVPMFDFGRVDDELFLVMEFIDGPNWANAMAAAKRKNAPPDSTLVSHIIFEACQALDYAHRYKDDAGNEQRIAHRDVTPGNLLLSFTGEVKLGDFGLAAATAGLSEGEGNTRGTPGYMAPEQARGELVGPPADVFSIGLILREALTLERVRSGTAEEQIAMAGEVLPPLPDEIPERLRAICERATSLKIDDRFESAQAMAEELDTFLLKARTSEQSDRRPMNARVADWLQIILPDGLKTGSLKGAKPAKKGAAITYLDHGTQEVLDAPTDATQRSMAATALEAEAGASAQATQATADLRGGSDKESKADPKHPRIGLQTTDIADDHQAKEKDLATGEESPRSSLASFGLGATILVAGAASLAYVLGGSDSKPKAASDAALPAMLSTSDAPPARADAAPSGDAATPHVQRADAQRPDAREDARTQRRKADAAPRAAHAILRVSTTPWATVTIVGRSESCDETPCQLKLPAGEYRIKLANPVAGLHTTITVTLSADKPTVVHEVLRAAPR